MNAGRRLSGAAGITLALLVGSAQACAAEGPIRGALKDNLKLLNLWGEQPEAVQRLYEAAYSVLAARPDATFADLADNPGIQDLCAKEGRTHFGGPMLGCVGPSGATVWLRTVRSAKVEVRVVMEDGENSFGPVESTRETDLTAVVPVTGLAPGRRYPYRVLVDGKPIAMPTHAAITTTPGETGPQEVRIAFGTCAHRWGLGNRKQADLIRSRGAAALLLYGDIAVQDRKAHGGLHRADYLVRDLFPAWQNLSCAVPVYATWDDHDYFANDVAGLQGNYTRADQARVREAFRRAWNNPACGFDDDRGGIFLRTRIGPCDVIMTDNRSFRGGKRRDKAFLGEDQMKWLEAQLLDCKGPFIILSCGTMWSDYVSNGKDSWGVNDPEGRERLFTFIEKNRIGGVLLISGDRHGASGWRIPRPSGYTFYEFEPASLGGRSGPGGRTAGPTDRQLFRLNGQFAFGEFTIDATAPDPTVTFRLVREDGSVFYELKLTRSQLTPPAS